MKKKTNKEKVDIKNRRAYFDFEITDKYEAGIMLTGSEVKSIRTGKVTLGEGFCFISAKGELFIRNIHISEYSHGSDNNHEPTRTRKLLLHKRELEKIHAKVKEKGVTIIPLRLYEGNRGILKMEIGIGKGKKTVDKRQNIKEKENKRQIDRVLKQYK